MSYDEQRRLFKHISKYLQRCWTIEEIRDGWIAAELGRPPGEKTVNRWLHPGPKTKNIYFEPFVITLATHLMSHNDSALMNVYRDHPEWEEERWQTGIWTFFHGTTPPANLARFAKAVESLKEVQS